MRIEELSIKTVTVSIFLMIGIFAIVLSLFAGGYFKRAAMDAQMNSLSRVIEVASNEVLKEVKQTTFDLAMRLVYSRELVETYADVLNGGDSASLAGLLDDPFVNGFVGFQNINLEKIRIYGLDLNLLAESRKGTQHLEKKLAHYLVDELRERHGIDRLKAIDALWLSSTVPMHSTLVPVGGLRARGYLEIIINPALNLPDIGKITKTPVSVFSASGEPINVFNQQGTLFLPVKYTIMTSDGKPAYRIVGYENVDKLNKEMGLTQVVTTSGFLILIIIVLSFSLKLLHRFLFRPVSRMISDMEKISNGNLDLEVNKKGLREFFILAEAFNLMANQVRERTNKLHESQNRLLHLLDLDNSAILCFGDKNDIIYFNKGASDFFGYVNDELNDLEFSDLFADDVETIVQDIDHLTRNTLHVELKCVPKQGDVFLRQAIINSLEVMGETGYAVVLNPVVNYASDDRLESVDKESRLDERDMHGVEQSLKRILEIAKESPGVLLGIDGLEISDFQGKEIVNDKQQLRQSAVNVMHAALICWEHDLGKSKLDLAEESRIWPVYIDKSTPTTRTLDKYLHVDSCPKNPRCQRVIDTATFVLKQLGDMQSEHQQRLMKNLNVLRKVMSGV